MTDKSLEELLKGVDLNSFFKTHPIEEEKPSPRHLRALQHAAEALQSDISMQEKAEFFKLLEEHEKRQQYSGFNKWFQPGTEYGIEKLPKHKAFFDAGKEYRERLLLGGNRSSKTISGCFEHARHLTGDYPEWWDGKRFNHPISGWAAGQTGLTTRDTLQKEMCGELGSFGKGMLPHDSIENYFARPGIPNGIDNVQVKHKSGGVSVLGFRSYDQDMKAFYGTAKHTIHLDEEPPELIYNECLIRTMTTKGIIWATCTPLHGPTPFIMSFSKNADHLAGAQRFAAVD